MTKEFEVQHQDRVVLYQLSSHCAESYDARTAADMGQEFTMFHRQNGPLSWRFGALVWMPVSYVRLIFSFALIFAIIIAFYTLFVTTIPVPVLSFFVEPAGVALGWIWWAITYLLSWILFLLGKPLSWLGLLFQTLAGSLPTAMSEPLTNGVAWVGATLGTIFDMLFWRDFDPKAIGWPANVMHGLRLTFSWSFLIGCGAGLLLLLFPKLASGRAFGSVDRTRNSATIIFCGSTFFDNIFINACVWRYKKPGRHYGFHRAWAHVKPGIVEWLELNLREGGEIILAGHSLGGALAEIAAFDLAGSYKITRVAAFGSSRIGDPKMREAYKARTDTAKAPIHECTWHITHDDDVIPRLPPAWSFTHVGRGYLLDGVGNLRRGKRSTILEQYAEASKASVPKFVTVNIYEPTPTPSLLATIASAARSLINSHLEMYSLKYFTDMLGYYVQSIKKGLTRDHKAGLYAKALSMVPAQLTVFGNSTPVFSGNTHSPITHFPVLGEPGSTSNVFVPMLIGNQKPVSFASPSSPTATVFGGLGPTPTNLQQPLFGGQTPNLFGIPNSSIATSTGGPGTTSSEEKSQSASSVFGQMLFGNQKPGSFAPPSSPTTTVFGGLGLTPTNLSPLLFGGQTPNLFGIPNSSIATPTGGPGTTSNEEKSQSPDLPRSPPDPEAPVPLTDKKPGDTSS